MSFSTYDAGRHLVMSDDPATEVDTGRNPKTPNPVRERVDQTIKDLTDRAVVDPDRARLRKALDTADAPEPGRKEGDKALGRISQRG